MNFGLSEEQRMAIDSWRGFLGKEVRPIVEAYKDIVFPKEIAHQLLRMMIPFGVGSGWVPEAEGGEGLDFVSSGLLYEELARISPSLAIVSWAHEGAALKIQQTANKEVKERYLPQLLKGDLIACSAISEPGAGSDVRGIRTRAVRDGSGYRITGEKVWISNCDIADIALVLASTGNQEFTNFLVDRSEHGFTTREIAKLGLNSSSFGQVVFEDVWVPETNILGGLGGGLQEIMKGFERARCFISLAALGISQAAIDAAIEYAKVREAFGAPIGSYQLVQQKIVEMATQLEAARLLVYRAVTMMADGRRCDVEAAMAKIFATEAAVGIASDAIQVHGSYGLTKDLGVERYFRDARCLTIPDGTTNINQLIIGRKLLGFNTFARPHQASSVGSPEQA